MNVSIKNLTKEYDGKRVLSIKEAFIPSGKIVAIVGENGSGKSTLIRIIAGLLEESQGEIYYEGDLKKPLKDMTLVFQKPYLISTTVEKNISYPLKLRGIEDEEKVTKILKDLKLEDLRKRKTMDLSGGEAQKVALGRALSFDPKLLFLDEPTANIDPKAMKEIEEILVKTNREKKTTIVIITHNFRQAKRLGDHIFIMEEGNMREINEDLEHIEI